jgi:hypothetical protein
MASAAKSREVRAGLSVAARAGPLACGVVAASAGYMGLLPGALLYMAYKIVEKMDNIVELSEILEYVRGDKKIDEAKAAEIQKKYDASNRGWITYENSYNGELADKFKLERL